MEKICERELEITELIKTLRTARGIIQKQFGVSVWEKAFKKYGLLALDDLTKDFSHRKSLTHEEMDRLAGID